MTGAAYGPPVPITEPHWYITNVDLCPVCLSERTERTRMPGEKPPRMEDRYIIEQHYDWCED